MAYERFDGSTWSFAVGTEVRPDLLGSARGGGAGAVSADCVGVFDGLTASPLSDLTTPLSDDEREEIKRGKFSTRISGL